MTKLEFLLLLGEKLQGLPQNDVDERLNFYNEMIEDRMEEGLSEEEAVAETGTVEEIAAQIVADIPLMKIAREKMKPRGKRKTWEIVLLLLGSPLWFSLLIAALAVVFSLYISLWAVVVSFWAVFAAFVGSAVGCIAGGVVMTVLGNMAAGITALGVGFFFAGLAIFTFFGCKAATKGAAWLGRKMTLGIKRMFIKKEAA